MARCAPWPESPVREGNRVGTSPWVSHPLPGLPGWQDPLLPARMGGRGGLAPAFQLLHPPGGVAPSQPHRGVAKAGMQDALGGSSLCLWAPLQLSAKKTGGRRGFPPSMCFSQPQPCPCFVPLLKGEENPKPAKVQPQLWSTYKKNKTIPFKFSLPVRNTVTSRAQCRAVFPRRQTQAGISQWCPVLWVRESLPTRVHCPGRITGALSRAKVSPDMLDPFCLPFLVIFTPLFSVSILMLPLQRRSKMPLPAGLLC